MKTRKFYIGDNVEIIEGEHHDRAMLICGISETYIAGGIDGKTVRVDKVNARFPISKCSKCGKPYRSLRSHLGRCSSV